MTKTPKFHHHLAERLRDDPAFAFAFARRIRDVPPVDESRLMQMIALSIRLNTDTLATLVHVPDVVLGAYVRRDAEPLPDREPWPRRWALLIEVLDSEPVDPAILVSWPLRHANLRATFGCPLTFIVVVPSHEIAKRIEELFSLEPELMPTLVVSSLLDESGESLRN